MDPGPLMLWWFGQGSVFHSVSGNGQYKRMPILLTIQTTDHCSKHIYIVYLSKLKKYICTDQLSNNSKRFMHKYLCNYQNKKNIITDQHPHRGGTKVLLGTCPFCCLILICLWESNERGEKDSRPRKRTDNPSHLV